MGPFPSVLGSNPIWVIGWRCDECRRAWGMPGSQDCCVAVTVAQTGGEQNAGPPQAGNAE